MIAPEYIIGFVEGEGCFGVAIQTETDRKPRKTNRKNVMLNKSFGFRIRPSFRISLAARDRLVLDEICDFFKVGKVYSVKDTGERSEMCQYAVQTFTDLIPLIQFFDTQKFYTSKGQSYQKWRKIVMMVNSGEHLTKNGFREISRLREEMNPRFNKERRLRPAAMFNEAIEITPRLEK